MPRRNIFTHHPASVGESYGQHFLSALSFSGAMLRGSLLCAIHAFLPFLFRKSGSTAIQSLYERMCINRSQLDSSGATLPALDRTQPVQELTVSSIQVVTEMRKGGQ